MVESADIAVVQRYIFFSMESMKLHHELRTIPVLDSNSSDCGLFMNMMQDTYMTATIPLMGWMGMVGLFTVGAVVPRYFYLLILCSYRSYLVTI
uniref:ULP_PROTEASE domain-containing protein n=1 Tax=Heterorhabditis bacteriophora TaxID=37862 RepID=A0A1I7X338_HETBA